MSDEADVSGDAVDDAVDVALDAALEAGGDGDQADGGDPLGDQADGGDPLGDLDQDDGGDWVDELTNALTRSPSKSIHEIDESEYFDTEAGGKNRMLLVVDDIVTNGDGLQNWMHLCIACVEIAMQETSASGESDSRDNPDTALEETDLSGVDVA